MTEYLGLIQARLIGPHQQGFKPSISLARAIACPACPAIFIVELRFVFDAMHCSGCGSLVSMIGAWDRAPRVATLIRPDRKPVKPRYPSSADEACPGAAAPALRPAPVEKAMVPLRKDGKS